MPTQSETSKLILSGIVLAIGLILLLCENSTLTHTLDSQRLIWTSGLVGVIVALPLAWLPRDLGQYARAAFMAMLAVGFALCSIAGTCFVNYRFSPQQKTILLSEVIDKTSRAHGKNTTYYLMTNRNPDLPLKVSYHRWMNTPLSYPVRLAVIPGRLGFPYIQGFADTATD